MVLSTRRLVALRGKRRKARRAPHATLSSIGGQIVSSSIAPAASGPLADSRNFDGRLTPRYHDVLAVAIAGMPLWGNR